MQTAQLENALLRSQAAGGALEIDAVKKKTPWPFRQRLLRSV